MKSIGELHREWKKLQEECVEPCETCGLSRDDDGFIDGAVAVLMCVKDLAATKPNALRDATKDDLFINISDLEVLFPKWETFTINELGERIWTPSKSRT